MMTRVLFVWSIISTAAEGKQVCSDVRAFRNLQTWDKKTFNEGMYGLTGPHDAEQDLVDGKQNMPVQYDEEFLHVPRPWLPAEANAMSVKQFINEYKHACGHLLVLEKQHDDLETRKAEMDDAVRFDESSGLATRLTNQYRVNEDLERDGGKHDSDLHVNEQDSLGKKIAWNRKQQDRLTTEINRLQALAEARRGAHALWIAHTKNIRNTPTAPAVVERKTYNAARTNKLARNTLSALEQVRNLYYHLHKTTTIECGGGRMTAVKSTLKAMGKLTTKHVNAAKLLCAHRPRGAFS
jgi:hypothetical protein